MSILSACRIVKNNQSQYATNEDFRKHFKEDADSLHLLSFLLTADHELAERCFVAGLEDCMNGNAVFREWAHSWARRVIVHNAIRVVAPHPCSMAEQGVFHFTSGNNYPDTSLHEAQYANVLALQDFDRFVYVLSVIEGYPDHNCAVLLNTSQQAVRNARQNALQHIADWGSEHAASEMRLSTGIAS